MLYENDGICFECNIDIDETEADQYIARAKQKGWKHVFANIISEDEVELTYDNKQYVPFERIRRITGYLVGTVDRFNDAKKAELNERVKHGI